MPSHRRLLLTLGGIGAGSTELRSDVPEELTYWALQLAGSAAGTTVHAELGAAQRQRLVAVSLEPGPGARHHGGGCGRLSAGADGHRADVATQLGAEGAALNVRINLKDINDKNFCKKIEKDTEIVLKEVNDLLIEIRKTVDCRLANE